MAPEVDHNWKIVGVDLSEDDPRRAELVGYINAGLLDTPYAESYNLSDYDSLVAQAKAKAETLTVTVNGAAKDVATAFDAQGNTYYRLRDLAFALKGTGAQFNVTWDGSVAVATGSAYEGEALALPGSAPTGEAVSLTLTVDGTAVSQPAVLVNGNYYLAERLPRPAGRGVRPGGGRFGHHRRVTAFRQQRAAPGARPFPCVFYRTPPEL